MGRETSAPATGMMSGKAPYPAGNGGPAPLRVPDSAGPLPERVDVVVIGAGIIGASAALDLIQAGQSVALLDKGVVAGEQSSRNWGWVRLAGRDLRELPLTMSAKTIWRAMSDRFGAALGYEEGGIVYVQQSAAQKARHAAWTGHARALGIESEMLDPAAVHALVPGIAREVTGALYLPQDAWAEPQAAAPLIARAAVEAGATLRQNCAVQEIEIRDGRVSGIGCEAGRIAADRVILAGGAWSGPFLRAMGLKLPQLKVLSSVCRSVPLSNLGPRVGQAPGPAMSFGDFALRRRADGGLTLASASSEVTEIVPDSFRHLVAFLPGWRSVMGDMKFRLGGMTRREIRWEGWKGRTAFENSLRTQRVLDPVPDRRALDAVHRSLARTLPALAGLPEEQAWGGMIDVLPDVIPVISTVQALPGLVIGTGFSGHGFGIGPGAGRLLSELARGVTPHVDPSAFRFERFRDGGPVALQTWL